MPQLPNAGAGVDFRQKHDRHRAVATGAALVAILAADISVAGDGADCPPNPEPGKCYEKVYSPAQYEERAEQVLDQPARIETRTIAESGSASPAKVERYTAPATYRIIMTRHKLRDASFIWQTVACGPGRTPPRTGD